MARVNACPNPSCASDATGWLSSGSGIRITGLSGTPRTTGYRVTFSGGAYTEYIGTPLIAASPGQVWTAVVWVRASAARNVQVGIAGYNSGSYVSAVGTVTVAVTAGTFTQVRVTGTLPTGVNQASIAVDGPNGWASGDVLSASSARMDPVSDSSMVYADGATSGWVWDGTAGSSTSRENTGATTDATGSGGGTVSGTAGAVREVRPVSAGGGTVDGGGTALDAVMGGGSVGGTASPSAIRLVSASGGGSVGALAGPRRERLVAASGGGSAGGSALGVRERPISASGGGQVTAVAGTPTRAVHPSASGGGTVGGLATATTSAAGMLNPSLWALDRVTGRLVPLPHHVKLEVHDVENDAGAITVDYPVYGKNFSLLEQNVTKQRDLEVEVWLEGRRSTRMVGWLKQRQGDDVTEGAVWSFTGTLVTSRLDEDWVAPQPADEKREFRVAAATPGAIMRTLIQQSQTAGALTDLTVDFTATHDSSGIAWPEVLTAKWSPGVTLLQVAQRLVELGLAEFTVTADRVLRMWRFGGRGTNRAVGDRPTTLRRGVNLLQAGRRQGVDDSGTDFLVAGGDGVYATATDLNARARRGRVIRRFSSVGNLTDTSAVNAAAQRTRDAGTTGNDERTFALALGVGMPRPGTNLGVGDTVRVDTAGTLATERLAQWTVTADVGGVAAQVTAGDLIRSRAAALAKRLQDAASGDTVIGTSESAAGQDTGIPLAPSGLVVGSAAFLEGSDVYASATAGWAAVQSNVDGTAATDLEGYRVEWALESAPDVWNVGADVTGTTGSFTVAPGTPIRVRVQARDRSGNRSAWSAVAVHTTEDDATAPPVCSAPVVSEFLGSVRITWDGLTAAGADMFAAAPDFDFVEVHLSTTSNFTPNQTAWPAGTRIGQLFARGTWTITDLPYDVAQYARLVPVDIRKNRQATPSAQGSATPKQLVTEDMLDGAVGTAKLGLLVVRNANIDNAQVNNIKVTDLSVAKLTGGVGSFDMVLAGNIMTATSGQRTRLGNDGLICYNASDQVTVRLNGAAGSILVTGEYRTAMTGARIVLNPLGSSPAESRWYPTDGVRYSRMKPLTSVADGFEGQGGINMKAYSARGDGQSGEMNVYPGLASLVWGNEADSGVITARIAVSQAENFYGGTRHRMVSPQAAGESFYGFFSVGGDNGGNWGGNPSVLSFTAAGGGTGNARLRNWDRNSGIQFDTGTLSCIQTSGALCNIQAGDVRYGTLTAGSGRSLKTNIAELPFDPLDVILGAPAQQWEYIEDQDGDDPAPVHFGPMADDMPTVLQKYDYYGRLSLDLSNDFGVLWAGTGDLIKQVRELTARVQELEAARG